MGLTALVDQRFEPVWRYVAETHEPKAQQTTVIAAPNFDSFNHFAVAIECVASESWGTMGATVDRENCDNVFKSVIR